MDKWLELNIFLKDYDRTNEVLAKLVKPMIDDLYSNKEIISWHYFREPFICWRILYNSKTRQGLDLVVRDRVMRFAESNRDLYEKYEEKLYTGESDLYGADAWELCYKRWEAGSHLALLLVTTEPTKPIPFHYTRDIHLFENQLGFDWSDTVTIFLKWTKKMMECDKSFDYAPYIAQLNEMISKTWRPSKIKGI